MASPWLICQYHTVGGVGSCNPGTSGAWCGAVQCSAVRCGAGEMGRVELEISNEIVEVKCIEFIMSANFVHCHSIPTVLRDSQSLRHCQGPSMLHRNGDIL